MRKIITGILTVAVVVGLILTPRFSYGVEAFTEAEEVLYQEAKASLNDISAGKDIMALIYLTDSYSVRQEPMTDAATVATVSSGQSVLIKGFEADAQGQPWIKVDFCLNDVEYTGYVERQYVVCSDEMFIAWEQEYAREKSVYSVAYLENGAQTGEIPADIQAFPESYQAALLQLKQAHPNWIFVKMDTGLEWSTVVKEESKGEISLIPTSMGEHMTEGIYSTGWSYPTKEALEYYLDPRNGLTENGIFQFELLSYNATYHEGCQEALQSFLDNTFMKGNVPQWVDTYAYAFWIIGRSMNISPFHLASRVYQEQGNGTSPLISGNYLGYEGYYNYFNIGASGSTNKQVIESGLRYAKNATPPWDCPYYALHFGAQILGSSYIAKGQDTLYLQKFDVDASNNGMYWHQYMQNICAPSSEAKSIRRLYNEVGALDKMFIFKIPVYNNMPDICPLPAESKQVVLKGLPGYSDAKIYLDGANYDARLREGYYIVEAPHFEMKTATMYQYDESGNPVGMSVWLLSSDGKYYTAKEVTELKDLFSYHGFSVRLTEREGIRFTTGIAEDKKAALTGSGLGRYTLKEYGTLIMTNTYRSTYPMIKGAPRVQTSMAYGIDEAGNKVDNVLETVNGRQHFTAVLVGVPSLLYKTNYAFRAYAVLQKDGEEIIVYGPIGYDNLVALAEQTLAQNLYAEGSEEYLLLKKLIKDGTEGFEFEGKIYGE